MEGASTELPPIKSAWLEGPLPIENLVCGIFNAMRQHPTAIQGCTPSPVVDAQAEEKWHQWVFSSPPSAGLIVCRTPAASSHKYSVGWAYVARTKSNSNTGCHAILTSWRSSRRGHTPQCHLWTVLWLSVRAPIACPTQSIPALVDKAN